VAQREETFDSNDMLKSLFAARDAPTEMGSQLRTPGLNLGSLMKDQMVYSSERNTTLKPNRGPSQMNDRRQRGLTNALSGFVTPSPGVSGALPRKGSVDTRGNLESPLGGWQILGALGNSQPLRANTFDLPTHQAQPPNNPNSGFGPVYFFFCLIKNVVRPKRTNVQPK
jgi:hypothetical protein